MPIPRSHLSSCLIAASALAAGAVAWLAQNGPAPAPASPRPRTSIVAQSESRSATIRLQRYVPPGRSCLRLRPARPYEGAFGGSGLEAVLAPAPSQVSTADGDLAFTRGAIEDWPGQIGGDASRP